MRAPAASHDRSADADPRFHPRVLRSVLERNECTHEGNENGRTDIQAELFRRHQMPQLVDEDEQHKPEGKLPSPHPGVDSDAENHRTSGLQDHGEKLQKRGDQELQLRAKFQQKHPHCDSHSSELLDRVADRLALHSLRSPERHERRTCHIWVRQRRRFVQGAGIIRSTGICASGSAGPLSRRPMTADPCPKTIPMASARQYSVRSRSSIISRFSCE